MIPILQVPSNELWHLSSTLVFLLNQLLGPAICEELYFRAISTINKSMEGPHKSGTI